MHTIRKNLYRITIFLIMLITIIVLVIKIKLDKNKYENIEPVDIVLEKETSKEEIKECTVDIKGAINSPGVYVTNCNSYVYDIIKLAEGLTESADTSNTNLAKKIKDEMVIIIYTKEEIANMKKVTTNECICPEITSDVSINNQNETNTNLININTSTLEELKNLPGIGESKAKAIIEYRSKVGYFKDISDIKNVSGIGENLYEQIKAFITT